MPRALRSLDLFGESSAAPLKTNLKFGAGMPPFWGVERLDEIDGRPGRLTGQIQPQGQSRFDRRDDWPQINASCER